MHLNSRSEFCDEVSRLFYGSDIDSINLITGSWTSWFSISTLGRQNIRFYSFFYETNPPIPLRLLPQIPRSEGAGQQLRDPGFLF